MAKTISKRTSAELLLSLPLPLDLLAVIATYLDNWMGGTEKDCYGVLKLWTEYEPHVLLFNQSQF